MGSLLVGVSFAKGLARSLDIPMVEVNHLQGHVLAHFIQEPDGENVQPKYPFICLLVSGGNSQIIRVNAYNDMEVLGQTIDDAAGEAIDKCSKVMGYPFICLLVSGGNSQIIRVNAYNDMEVLGQTIDDAAGEAIDKCSKVMGLGYPGGPIIDKLARQGNPETFKFSKPHIPGYDYSFSGLKTSFLYSLRDWMKEDPDFVEHHKTDLAAYSANRISRAMTIALAD